MAVSENEGTLVVDFKVWNPPAGSTIPRQGTSVQLEQHVVGLSLFKVFAIVDLPDSYFEPTTKELKATYQSQVQAREALANAPLKTQEIRDRELKAKMARWPTTRIRVKFPDRTQLERTFPSTDKIRSVYAFVRNSLRDDIKPNKFILYQTPPRRELKVSDPTVRNLSLFELHLSPSSVLLLAFLDDSLNDPGMCAPLLESMLAQSQDLPPPPTFDDATPETGDDKSWKKKSTSVSKDVSGKPLPKWLKIGKS
ncbi:hypothetical protein BU17DRAFT_55042 [Hysterangium stoloniferum]|nr:hypothetical protein BU17DRAFT_55042 [Hysterangium stoloniferum]